MVKDNTSSMTKETKKFNNKPHKSMKSLLKIVMYSVRSFTDFVMKIYKFENLQKLINFNFGFIFYSSFVFFDVFDDELIVD